ncbi:MAG: hypothetical protein ACSHYB_13600 [Roseibacillus sp.]
MKNIVLPLILASSFLSGRENEIEPNSLLRPLHAHEVLTGHFHQGYDSRYFTEGRDGLDGDSLLTTAFELGYEHFAFGAWFGISPEQNYDELQLSAAYIGHLGDVEYYLSWTHFEFSSFFPGREQDNEIGFGLSYGELPYELNIAFNAYYSLEVEGSFMELSLDRSSDLTDQLSLGVLGTFGMNQGYVSDGHDGANHLALSSSLDYALTESLTLSLHATYSWALDQDANTAGDETLIDFFHAGTGIMFAF